LNLGILNSPVEEVRNTSCSRQLVLLRLQRELAERQGAAVIQPTSDSSECSEYADMEPQGNIFSKHEPWLTDTQGCPGLGVALPCDGTASAVLSKDLSRFMEPHHLRFRILGLPQILKILNFEDPRTIVKIRGLGHRRGTFQVELLRSFFSTYGPVVRVLQCGSSCGRRPGNLAFVQMCSSQVVDSILKSGSSWHIQGFNLKFQEYLSQALQDEVLSTSGDIVRFEL